MVNLKGNGGRGMLPTPPTQRTNPFANGMAHANERALDRSAAFSGRQPGGAGGRKQFEPYAAGRKVYGGGRSAPNVGKTANMAGYGRRDGAVAARKQAFLDRAKRFS